MVQSGQNILEFLTSDGEKLNIEVPPKGKVSSFFVFALPKSGSVLQDKVFQDIASSLDIPLISVEKTAFNQGIDQNSLNAEEICELFTKVGYGFYGFRSLPRYLQAVNLDEFKKIFLIRDPRDILVSHYFSMMKSHTTPPGAMGDRIKELREQTQSLGIDDYVLEKAPAFLSIFNSYENIKNSNHLTFKYENIVFSKSSWIADILSYLNLSLSAEQIEEIAAKHDLFPKKEDSNKHVRRVTPGDHKDKLKATTIDKLNKVFEHILEKYKYAH